MEEKFGRLLFIVAFCQFHTSMCNLLALNRSLTLLLSAMKKPRLLCSILLYQIQQRKKKCTLSTGLQETPLIWFEAPVAPVVTLVLECVEEVLVNVSSPWAYTLRESSSVQSHAWWTRQETSLWFPPCPQASSYRFTGKKALRKDGRKSLWHILHFRQMTMRAYVLFVFWERDRGRSGKWKREKKVVHLKKCFLYSFSWAVVNIFLSCLRVLSA